MATYYIEALQTVQPRGPYHLGGWSLGGIIAFEMAQKLQQQGHEIALLALVDSYVLAMAETTDALNEFAAATLLAQDLLGHHDQATLIPIYSELEYLSMEEKLVYILAQAKEANTLPLDYDLGKMRRLFDVFQANLKAAHQYTPKPYSGCLTLFQAEIGELEMRDRGWEKVAHNIKTYHLPGNHYTIVQEPNVQVLAEHLNALLAKPSIP